MKNKRILFACVTLAFLANAALLLVLLSQESNDAESIIIRKRAGKPVQSRFSPVLVYRIAGDKAFFSGSGSLYVGGQGEQVITCEHLFRKELGDSIFAFRKLCPFEPVIANGINRILHTGPMYARQVGETPDIIALGVGMTNLIRCFSDRKLAGTLDVGTVSRIDNGDVLTSLVSGEKARVVGILKSPYDAGSQYLFIEYEAISGESGMGFVNKSDALYVLKGICEWAPEDEKLVQKVLRSKYTRCMVYGPLSLRK